MDPQLVVVAGYTGRDNAGVELHVRELERLGVARPASVPAFFPVSPNLLTQDRVITELADSSSGEAEFALVLSTDGWLVTIASDHTDRILERVDVGLSKRVCPKLVGTSAWRLDDVLEHWDELELHSWVAQDGGMRKYQQGSVAQLLRPMDLLARIPWGERERPPEFVVLGGTIPTLCELSFTTRFRAELRDPVLERRLVLDYAIRGQTRLESLAPARTLARVL